MRTHNVNVFRRNSVTESPRLETDDIVVAVMGATGSGKSTFINLVSGSNLAVGEDLKSCTSKVQLSRTFSLFNRTITLVDTPGFDDTTISDTDILRMIAVFLSSTYEHEQKLHGVIWMHRITDRRVGGIAKRNFNMFQKLCGDESLKNVVIATSMWNEVLPERGEAREHQLRTDNILFGPAIDQGAVMFRHGDTLQSAQDILQYLVDRHPRALQIQRELVDEKKDIKRTAAGEELDRELAELVRRHMQELEKLRCDMASELAAKDTVIRELEDSRRDLLEKIKEIENDRDRISREFQEEKERVDARMRQVEAELAEERRVRRQRQREVDPLIARIEMGDHTRAPAGGLPRQRIIPEGLPENGRKRVGFLRRVGGFFGSLFHDDGPVTHK